jgi:uncharacterized protein
MRRRRTGRSWRTRPAVLASTHWVNADLLPGVKVDTDVLIRLINLTQEGYVEIQP